jgi:hypothetical protein
MRRAHHYHAYCFYLFRLIGLLCELLDDCKMYRKADSRDTSVTLRSVRYMLPRSASL